MVSNIIKISEKTLSYKVFFDRLSKKLTTNIFLRNPILLVKNIIQIAKGSYKKKKNIADQQRMKSQFFRGILLRYAT